MFRLEQADANTLLGVAALLTSVIAVLVAWDESRVLRQAYRTAFTPILEVRMDVMQAEDQPRLASGEGRVNELAFRVRNVGPGVAELRSATLTSEGEPIGDWDAFSGALLAPILARDARVEGGQAAGFVEADASATLIRLTWPDSQIANVPLRQTDWTAKREAVTAEVCYCSLFDECWTARAGRTRPEPVRECPEGDAPFAAIARSYGAGS